MEEKQVGTDSGANDDNREKGKPPTSLLGEKESNPAAASAKTNRLAVISAILSLAALLILCGVGAAMMSPRGAERFVCGVGPASQLGPISVCVVVPAVLVLAIATGIVAHDQIGRRAGIETGLRVARIGLVFSVTLIPCWLFGVFLLFVTTFGC